MVDDRISPSFRDQDPSSLFGQFNHVSYATPGNVDTVETGSQFSRESNSNHTTLQIGTCSMVMQPDAPVSSSNTTNTPNWQGLTP